MERRVGLGVCYDATHHSLATPKVLPAGRRGAICIDLQPSGPGLLMLSTRDDTVGLPEDFDLLATWTLA